MYLFALFLFHTNLCDNPFTNTGFKMIKNNAIYSLHVGILTVPK